MTGKDMYPKFYKCTDLAFQAQYKAEYHQP